MSLFWRNKSTNRVRRVAAARTHQSAQTTADVVDARIAEGRRTRRGKIREVRMLR